KFHRQKNLYDPQNDIHTSSLHLRLLDLFAGRFGDLLHLCQTALKIVADDLIHVEEKMHGFRHEIIAAGHAPCDGRAISIWLERELRHACSAKRLEKFQPYRYELVRAALGYCHASGADLLVALPAINRAGSRRRTVKDPLHRRVASFPRRPILPVVKIVYLLEDYRRRSRNGRASRDAEFRWLQRHDNGDDGDEDKESDDDFFQHGSSEVYKRRRIALAARDRTDDKEGLGAARDRLGQTRGACASYGRGSCREASDSAPRGRRAPSAALPVPRHPPEPRRRRARACGDARAEPRGSWDGLCLNRHDRRQIAHDRRPARAAIGGAVDLSAARAEIDTARVERVDRHRVAQHVDIAVALRQPLGHRLPLVAAALAAENAELPVEREMLRIAL